MSSSGDLVTIAWTMFLLLIFSICCHLHNGYSLSYCVEHPLRWSPTEVCDWSDNLGLALCAGIEGFAERNVDGPKLMLLQPGDLKNYFSIDDFLVNRQFEAALDEHKSKYAVKAGEELPLSCDTQRENHNSVQAWISQMISLFFFSLALSVCDYFCLLWILGFGIIYIYIYNYIFMG